MKSSGPYRNEDPGSSNSTSGVRISTAEGARVSQQCSSAVSKPVLTSEVTPLEGKGDRLIFLCHLNTRGNARLVSDASGYANYSCLGSQMYKSGENCNNENQMKA